MKRIGKAVWFISGVLTSALIAQLVAPAMAALTGKTIEVHTGVNIYVDDVKLNPQDANGNLVEAFVYNGTTYLPVRAVGEAVGKTVQWEGKTSSVYLGKHTGESPAVWLTDLDYFTGKSISQSMQKDNLGNTYPQAIAEDFCNTYIINGQYSAISGTLFLRYEDRSTFNNKTLQIYGDGKLLYSATVTGGVQPIDFYVDLTGVLTLELDFSWEPFCCRAAIGNCGLWT